MNLRYELSSFLVATLFVVSLLIGAGVNLGALLLVVFGAIFAWKTPKKLIDSDTKILLFIFCIYFFVFLISMLVYGERARILDRPSRILLSVFVLLVLLRFPPREKVVSIGIVFGAIFSGIVGFVFHTEFHDYGRAFVNLPESLGGWSLWSKGYMPIQSGNIALSLGIFSLVVAIYYYRQCKYYFMTLAFSGFIAGIMASVFSGTRGGWVCIPFILLVIVYFNRAYFRLFVFGGLLSLAICFIGGDASVYELAKSRMSSINAELVSSHSSSGARLELWKDAFYTFKERPLLGAGNKDRVLYRIKHKEDALVSLPDAFNDAHAHNQFLEALSVRGGGGFLSLMILFLWPFHVFKKRHNMAKNFEGIDRIKQESVCQLGICHVILVMGYCMTQAYLEHNSGITFYAVTLVIFFAMSSPSKYASRI